MESSRIAEIFILQKCGFDLNFLSGSAGGSLSGNGDLTSDGKTRQSLQFDHRQ